MGYFTGHTPLCGHCHQRPRRAPGQSYCRECHNAHMRKTRPKYRQLTPEQRFKANARSYARQYVVYGKLKPKPCESCGDPKAQKHHDDYSKPLEVRWLCVNCHILLHRKVG